jgi:hypothetical protein
MAEVKLLQSRDRGHGKIEFVDVNLDDYDPHANADISFEQAINFPSLCNVIPLWQCMWIPSILVNCN